MASGDEHRMVFDIRGKRRHVVKVVYAILAVLIGVILFLVTGAVNIGSLVGSNSGGSSTAGLEEQTEKLERRLAKEPENSNTLLALTKAQINVANQQVNIVESEGQQFEEQTPESRAEMQRASENWSRYLESTDEPSVGGALYVAPALFRLAQSGSSNLAGAVANVQAAADAQQIVADGRPSLNAWSTLAIYRYLGTETAAAEKAEAEAKKLTTSKFERENLENTLAEYAKAGKQIEKELETQEKAGQGASKEGLENPFSGLGGP